MRLRDHLLRTFSSWDVFPDLRKRLPENPSADARN